MRYAVLKPSEPVDPRELELRHLDDLHAVMPVVMDCETESQAVAYVRRVLPDAVAMPVPLAIGIGSGKTFLLGLIADGSRRVDPDGEIPFALCVQAVAQNDADRHRAKKGPVFDRLLWKVKPVCPELAQSYRVELRATDLDVPAYVDAKVGHHNGKLVIYVELGGIEMSIGFIDPVTVTPASYASPRGVDDRSV